MFRAIPFTVELDVRWFNGQNASLNNSVSGGVWRGVEDPAVRNECFVFLSRDNCEPRLPGRSALESGLRICWRLDLTYKCEKMVEMAMRLSQKDLYE
jgi:hypothetical protein